MRNLLGGPGFGTAYHTLIQYQPPGAREPYDLYIFEHDLVMSYEYTKGSTVELVYDAEAPYRAYSKLEWERALKNFQKAWVCFGISGMLLWVAWLIR